MRPRKLKTNILAQALIPCDVPKKPHRLWSGRRWKLFVQCQICVSWGCHRILHCSSSPYSYRVICKCSVLFKSSDAAFILFNNEVTLFTLALTEWKWNVGVGTQAWSCVSHSEWSNWRMSVRQMVFFDAYYGSFYCNLPANIYHLSQLYSFPWTWLGKIMYWFVRTRFPTKNVLTFCGQVMVD